MVHPINIDLIEVFVEWICPTCERKGSTKFTVFKTEDLDETLKELYCPYCDST